MSKGYQDPEQVKNYSNFLESEDGKTQKKIILDAVLKCLSRENQSILDLGCGPGWLCNELSKQGYLPTGCDASEAQINLAKKNYPSLNFVVSDPENKLPFPDAEFEVAVASLVLNDIKNQTSALKEIRRVLKPGGKLVNIITNPYYAYPVGKWKRGILGRLFRKKPSLILSPYFGLAHNEKSFTWRKNLPGHFYPLSEQINNLVQAGFYITNLSEPKSTTDDTNFSRKYQLYRYPLYIVIECQAKNF